MYDNPYFELSDQEKHQLESEIFHDLRRLVIDFCSYKDDLVSSIDYNEFGNFVLYCLKRAVRSIDCPYLCGYAWGANGR